MLFWSPAMHRYEPPSLVQRTHRLIRTLVMLVLPHSCFSVFMPGESGHFHLTAKAVQPGLPHHSSWTTHYKPARPGFRALLKSPHVH
ncbi:hypothetical protein BDV95DRAFT_90000 [Massariosphaeria phaeospora]|uniref:Uncharacterized protein n=1 Tax=Massariosphaeria phaeospora TaxID=100035 RepID=A0A7C8I3F2_9PLEO|nr:hypothetical protein BDV95DRAFT_90000 [Massariosphaeria phaeospora]